MGFLCLAETPEGGSVGVVKNLTQLAHVTIPSNSSALYDFVEPFIEPLSEDACPNDYCDKVKVFVNGCWLGISNEPYELYLSLKKRNMKELLMFIHRLSLIVKNWKFVFAQTVEG